MLFYSINVNFYKENLQNRELFEFMHHIFNTNSQILKWYFSKHPLSMHRNTWHCIHWMLTSCLLFSAVYCLHLPCLVCFTVQWAALPSLSTLDFVFLFQNHGNVTINLLQSSIWKLSWVLVISLPLLINCQLVVCWLLHTNVGIHNHKNYQKPQHIFPPFFFFTCCI